MIGYMAMPADFEFKDLYAKGQPVHQWTDAFRLKHPSMDPGHRAKIFAPFDALAGFGDAVASKEVLYEFRREMSEEEKEELNRRVGILYRLTWNGKLARENRASVSVTYYIPCGDKDSFSYGYRGQYVTVSGICRKVGMKSILVDETAIPLKDIARIESNQTVDGRGIFDSWEVGAS